MAVKGIGVIILFLILILAGAVTSGILIVRNPCKREIPETPLRPGKPVGRQARIYETVQEKGGPTQYIGPEFTVASSFCPDPHGTIQCNPNAGPGTNTTCQCCPGPVPCPGSEGCDATCGGVAPSCPNCLNGGTCVNGKCVCLPNFGGPSCASGKCSNGNLCNPDLGPPKCQCCTDGSPCPGSPSECATTPVSKGGCGPESGGKTCPPCINGGACNTKTGVCDCLPGWGDPICSSGLCPDGKTLCNPAGPPDCQCCPGGGPCPHSPDTCKTTCVTKCTPNCPPDYCGPDKAGCGTTCQCPQGQQCQNNKCVTVTPPTQPTRLQVESKCKDPIWISLAQNLCDLNRGVNNTKLTKGGSPLNLNIPAGGAGSLGFHARRDCLVNGNACASGQWTGQLPSGQCIGDTVDGKQVVPSCVWPNYSDRHCQPPYSTYFEATYEPTTGTNNLTNFDTSAVNGYDIPISVDVSNPGGKCKDVSCDLDLSQCPQSENLTKYRAPGSGLPTVVKGQDLTSVDLRVFDKYDQNNKPVVGATVIGCMSPCQKLTAGLPWGLDLSPSDPVAKWYCCTHMPECTSDGQCQTSITKDYMCVQETDLWGKECVSGSANPCGIGTWDCKQASDGKDRCYRASRGNCQAPANQKCDVGWTAAGMSKSTCPGGYNCNNGVCVTGSPGCNSGKCPINSSCNSAGWCELVDSPKCCPNGYDCDSAGICKEVQIVNPQCNAKDRPVTNTDYVKWVKASCPDTYAWQYDDLASDIDCPDNTSFKVTYCPTGTF